MVNTKHKENAENYEEGYEKTENDVNYIVKQTKTGKNKWISCKIVQYNDDNYIDSILKVQYNLHKNYVQHRIKSMETLGIKVRLPSIPEDISENIIKFILCNKRNDISRWASSKSGDLFSEKEGVQECKCFTSKGPSSFTPISNWDVIYFLDARNWLIDKFILYRIPLKRTSEEWKNILVNKKQTFEDQCKQGRRPRITWKSLYPQVSSHCTKVFDGSFEEIFIPVEAIA